MKIKYLLIFSVLFVLSCGSGTDPKVAVAPEHMDKNSNKISDNLERKFKKSGYLSTSTSAYKVAIALKKDPSKAYILSAELSDSDITYKTSDLVYAVFAELDASTIKNLSMNEEVSFIEEDYAVKTTLMYSTKQIGARRQWDSNYKGEHFGGTSTDIRLAVIDTGIDVNHSDFSPSASRVPISVDCYTTTTCENKTINTDDNSHGTHVAGIVLGGGNSVNTAATPDEAYLEVLDVFTAPNTGATNFFSVQYKGTNDRKLNAKFTWVGTAESGFAFKDKASAEANSSDLIGAACTGVLDTSGLGATGDGTTPNPGQFIACDSDITISTSDAVITPYGFIGYTTDQSLVGNTYAAQVQTTVESWDDGSSETALAGVAPDASLVGIKALGSSGGGSVSNIVRALDYVNGTASANNIIAVNLSLSISGGLSSVTLNLTAKNLVNNGVVVVASAGNEQGTYYVGSPGSDGSSLTVGAVNGSDQLTNYSSMGSPDSVKKPDVLAPGGSSSSRVYLTAPKTTHSSLSFWNDDNADVDYDPYTMKIGTSQAAPHVTGLIGLMASKLTAGWTFGSSTMPKLFKMLICMTAVEIGAGESGAETPGTPERAGMLKDTKEGYGRISADGALGSLSAWDYQTAPSANFTFGTSPHDVKTFARKISLSSANEYNFTMSVPTSADYDLYLFSGTPDDNGEPVLLASSALLGASTERIIDFVPAQSGDHYIVSKWVSGAGQTSIVLESQKAKPSAVTQISDIRFDKNMRDQKIVVSWKTNVPTTSILQYGSVGGMGNEIVASSDLTTEQSATIDIEHGNYYYARILASSTGSSEQEKSTAVSAVYRINANTSLESNPSIDELPIATEAGGCGSITSSGTKNTTSWPNTLIILIPFFILYITRKTQTKQKRI